MCKYILKGYLAATLLIPERLRKYSPTQEILLSERENGCPQRESAWVRKRIFKE